MLSVRGDECFPDVTAFVGLELVELERGSTIGLRTCSGLQRRV
jgi:hypothetical protein